MARDIFIFNMRNRDAQNELSRETKTPEEALRIAMSYERADKYAKSYKGIADRPIHLQGVLYRSKLKTEPISNIRGSR